MFLRLLFTDLKRIREILLPLLLTTAAFAVCLVVVISVSDRLLYKKTSVEPVSVGLMADTSSSYAKMAYSMVIDMDSYQTTCKFTEVSSEAEGLRMLQDGKIRALVVIPDNIIESIIEGTGNPVRVHYNQDGTLETHTLNAVFLATASMMTTAQAATTIICQAASKMPITETEQSDLSADIDSVYMNRVLSRTDLFLTKELRLTGSYSTYEYYTCSGILLLLSFSGLVFLGFVKGTSPALFLQLKCHGANRISVLCSQFIILFAALYLVCLFVFSGCALAGVITGVSFLQFNIQSLFSILPAIGLLDLLILLAGNLPVSYAGACLLYFSCILVLAYLGGGIVPVTLLPDTVKHFASSTPFYRLLHLMCKGCYGSVL